LPVCRLCGHALAGDCPGRGQSDTGRRPQCRGRAQRSSVLGAPIIQSDNSASSILPASCVQYAGEYCARADARYCSKACRERARWHAKRQKNDAASLDTVPPENETEKRTSGLPNASCRHAGMLSEKRRFPPLPAQRGPSMRFDGGNSGGATIRTIRIASGRTIMP